MRICNENIRMPFDCIPNGQERDKDQRAKKQTYMTATCTVVSDRPMEIRIRLQESATGRMVRSQLKDKNNIQAINIYA